VELGGYTGHSRIAALLHRPAPVQLSYLGYFAPTYLDAIDGWIGDRALFAGLTDHERKAHQLWQVAGGYMTYQPPADLAKPKRIAGNKVRFGSFNHSRKLTTGTFMLYARVLQAAPNSELVLKSISFVEDAERERVRGELAAAGVDRSRVLLLDATESISEHLELYGTMDIALDPFPYGGATTTCEALIMGIPVVTLGGPGMVGRLSSSILAGAGLGMWVANDEDDYVELARKLACEGLRSNEQRQNLQKEILGSALCDPLRLTKELEQIYREASEANFSR